MRNTVYLFMFLIFLSCTESAEREEEETGRSSADIVEGSIDEFKLKEVSNPTFTKWVNYYKKQEENFNLPNFQLQSTDSLMIMEGSVRGSFDENFDTVYNNFLVYSPDKSKYIDFDSYSWSLDEDAKPAFSPDQEINLVDLNNETVTRVAFRGPSYRVEDVFWRNNQEIVLLENNDEKQPIITKINLEKKLVQTFIYLDTLSFDTNYSELRLKEKGLRTQF